MISKKSLTIFEIFLILFSVISFSYLVSTNLPVALQNPQEIGFLKFLEKPLFPLVSANELAPSGCCLQTNSGAICQEMNLLDAGACSSSLIGTSCSQVSECQSGCCYTSTSGACTLNAPKQKCEQTGGSWSNDATCNIAECQLGCCVLGDSVAMDTSRECTLLAEQNNLQKDFRSLDAQGSCNAYIGLSQQGACLTPSNDFSNEKNCVFTTKGNCNGDFKQGFLCTAKGLNTTCQKTQQTTCVDGKTQVYYLDSCGNVANVYDSNKYNDDSYWEKYISPDQSCQSPGASCGNCDYSKGSVCSIYTKGRDTKPTFGNYVCQNLNCANGKKNGESWCVSDYNAQGIANAPVGSRNYVAKCVEGQISIDPCADFNQEVCIQSFDNQSSTSQATCIINDWRSCLQANQKNSYQEVKSECQQFPQCIMFNDIPGNEKYKDLPGFKENLQNSEQGNAGKIGQDANQVLAYCVPRFTPGFQFWTTPSDPFTNSSNSQGESNQNYGGSKEEADSLCSIGSFTCVSHVSTDTSIAGGSSSTDKENPECNFNAVDESKQKVSLLMEALNERCRSIGTCGTQVNIQGQLGSSPGFTVQRTYIDKNGKTHENYPADKYNLSKDYTSSLSGKQSSIPIGTLKKLTDITSLNGGVGIELLFLSLFTGRVTESSTNTPVPLSQISGEAQSQTSSDISNSQQNQQLFIGGVGAVGALSALGGSSTATTASSVATISAQGTQSILSSATSPTTISYYGGGGMVFDPATSVATLDSAGNTLTIAPKGSPLLGNPATNPAVVPGTTEIPVSSIASIGGKSIGTTIPAGSTFTAGEGGATILTPSGTEVLVPQGQSIAIKGGDATLSQGAGKVSSSTSATQPSALTQIAVTAAAMVAAYFIGKMIAKNQGMSPAETTNFVSAMMAGASVAVATYYAIAATSATTVVGLVIAAAYFVYSLFAESTDNEYYIMQYTCQVWQPPKQGDCSTCNSDVRPCSEDKCRSLGNNCHYFIQNGEPGYCATTSDIWQATIKPWQDVLTKGDKYTGVQDNGFIIQGETSAEVPAWQPVTFGVITDKQAICKIDTNYSASYDQMSYTMLSSMDYQTGKVDGMHHQITLSPQVTTIDANSSTTGTTLPLNEGENDYFIKCKNFAGQTNEAPFEVKVTQAEGPDLTPPQILDYSPKNNAYLAKGANSTQLFAYLNEPAECKYSVEYDESNYGAMPYNFSCSTDSNAGYYGQWPCFTQLTNLTPKTNLFIKCNDTAGNIDPQSFQYSINVCETGLSFDIISPTPNQVISTTGSANVDLKIQTTGCINGGDAICSFNLPEYGNENYVQFFKTGNRTHEQLLQGLSQGNHTVNIKCIDPAGNLAQTNISFSIFVDNQAPIISRAFVQSNSLVIKTNEPAQCSYIQNNESIGCDFPLKNLSTTFSTTQSLSLNENSGGTFFIKCVDKFGNQPTSGCTQIINVIK